MGEGGELYVTSHVLNESSGSKVCLRVRDTGPGIPPEKVDKIFEPFYTTKAAGEGTGLGLSISRAIVDSFGGRLTVAIRGGVGAEFVLLLNQVEEEKSAGFDCR
jgi:signal transduction histidine kinase